MSDVRKGFVTQVGMELDVVLARAAELEMDFVELMMDGELHRSVLGERAADIQDMAADHDVALLVHVPFLDIGSPHEHVRAGGRTEVEACLATAAEIGAEKAVVHAQSNAWGTVWDAETIQTHILDSVQQLHEAGQEKGVAVCVENVPEGFFPVHDFPILFEQTDAAMTLDTGHARIDGMDSREMASFVREYQDRISHFHLNDTRRPRDEHLPFGAGDIDFEQLFQALTDDWPGTLSLEVFTRDWDYLAYSKERLDQLI